MNLFDLVAKITLDTSEYESGLDGASKKTSGFASKLKTGLATAAKAGAAAIGAASTAVAALTKMSVSAYADYEQLVGGVETLFKGSASTVESYAANAFQTAGLSANDYMETVTSFSASLLQGLGGDTAQAAEVANTAITDMADNANKMGTSMQSIQDAYQGFAKQNYTMLDNLKLGYGGTQSEMIRLINDSGILNEEISSLDGITFDQMIEAIHVIQTEMGITGTTAKEASTTIEGSWGSLKSAWSNLMTGLATGENLDTLFQQVIDSAGTFANNLIPRIQTTLESLGTAFETLGPILAEKLPGAIGAVAPALGSAALSLVTSFGYAIISNTPALLQSGVDAAANLINGLSSGLAQNIPVFLAQALPMLVQFTGQLRENAGQLVDAGLNLILQLAQGIADSLPILIENIPQIITNIAGIINDNAPKLLITAGTIIFTLARGLIEAIPTLIANIPQIIQAIVSVFTAFNWINLGRTVLTAIKNGITAMPEALRSIASNAVNKIKSAFSGGGIGNTVTTVFNGVKTAISTGMNAAKSAVSSVLDAIKSAFSSKLETAKTVVKTAIDKIKGLFKFSWSLPKLKLPHISISGSFSLNPPSVPHFGISWYRKAMNNAMLLSSPTIFGMMNGNLLGGGEAGQEVVAGANTLMRMIQEAVGGRRNVSYTQIFNSPKALSRREIRRETRNMVREIQAAW